MNSYKDSSSENIHIFNIKRILVLIRVFGFYDFWQQQVVDFGLCPREAVREIVYHLNKAIDYIVETNDKNALELMRLLIIEVEKKHNDSVISRKFVKLIVKILSKKVANYKHPTRLIVDNYKYN